MELIQYWTNVFFFFIDLLKVNYDKFTIRLNFLFISSMFANFQENRISIVCGSKTKARDPGPGTPFH